LETVKQLAMQAMQLGFAYDLHQDAGETLA
jgi:hypothetical protein